MTIRHIQLHADQLQYCRISGATLIIHMPSSSQILIDLKQLRQCVIEGLADHGLSTVLQIVRHGAGVQFIDGRGTIRAFIQSNRPVSTMMLDWLNRCTFDKDWYRYIQDWLDEMRLRCLIRHRLFEFRYDQTTRLLKRLRILFFKKHSYIKRNDQITVYRQMQRLLILDLLAAAQPWGISPMSGAPVKVFVRLFRSQFLVCLFAMLVQQNIGDSTPLQDEQLIPYTRMLYLKACRSVRPWMHEEMQSLANCLERGL